MRINAKSNVLAVIPVRLGASRLPGKPLKEIAGKTLVQRVWERAQSCNEVSRCVVATDGEEIAEVVRSFGGDVVMTSANCQTGSERVAEAANIVPGAWDLVVNIQGDMPFIKSKLVDDTIMFLRERTDFDMATAATPMLVEHEFLQPSNVKVVVSSSQQALYFSRSPIPYSREGDRLALPAGLRTNSPVFGYKHFGLYAFRPHVLEVYKTPDLSALERIERLEQLRTMEAGYRIGVLIADPEMTKDSVEVDTPEDLTRAEQIARSNCAE